MQFKEWLGWFLVFLNAFLYIMVSLTTGNPEAFEMPILVLVFPFFLILLGTIERGVEDVLKR